ncbi:calcium/proton exchanger [Bryobacter aggregatus]|uniref:calcium/proton exchanger n=1 Tax=Bryobacter aggregatus TaxID=360054 RepID=UPI0004E12316|nr:calcium/proton exchanger [Bryobacter aggregatus]
MNWLLLLSPVVMYLHFTHSQNSTVIFVLACAAILPLAGWLGHATEHLAAKTNDSVGGLLNATFGNAAELIIAISALRAGLYDVVKASLTGSIIGNLLLVLGASILAGGLKYREQRFSAQAAKSQTTLLALSAISLILPASFHYLTAGNPGAIERERDLSLEFSILLLVIYGLSLLFSLRTHKHYFATEAEEESHESAWSVPKSLSILALATATIAVISEILVHHVEHAATSMGMSSIFVGVIVVAIVGNAAEHSTAILVARKNRMDLSLSIAIGSSLQIAIFVAPLLVVLSYFIAPKPLDLVFTLSEVIAVVVSVFITAQVADDGVSHWMEGVLLLGVYIMLGILFFFLPVAVTK